jgi:type II secretory pathway pseudopilin PulG
MEELMKRKNMKCVQNEKGYVLLGVLVALAISLVITAGMLQSATGSLTTRIVVEKNAENFYDVERSINAVTAWLQSNSKNIVTAFNSTNFTNNFDLGTPSTGTNQGTTFSVPTLIKMKGTTNAVQLTNDSYFGTSAFPATTNIDTGAAFNAATEFASADFGSDVKVRLVAVWALNTNGHYQPIFRVDAITGGSTPDRGVHGVNFIKSALVTGNAGDGYYASSGDFLTQTPNNTCWSYKYSWSGAAWSRGAARSNCIVTSSDMLNIGSAIHGSILTNNSSGINYGTHGTVSGSVCEGPGCVAYTLPNHDSWTTRCGAIANSAAYDRAGTAAGLSIASGAALAQQCIRDITVASNRSVIFTTTNQPYYIRNLTLQNNSNSKMRFNTTGPGNKYTLYVDNFVGGSINGNQLVGTNLAPHQLEIFLTQDGSLTLNGTASMNGVIVGRENHTIRHNGNFPFYGAYRSGTVEVLGNATLGYDEDLGSSPALSDINFTLYKASQRYR